jgi:hypothetical protein
VSCPKPTLHARARDYALDRLTEAERNEFEDHLVGCAACTDTVGALGDRLLALEGKVGTEEAEQPAWVPRLHWSPALAAGIVLLVLAYPAYLGLVRLPGAREEVRQLGELSQSNESEIAALQAARDKAETKIAELEQSPAMEGALEVTYLSQPVRGAASVPSVPIEPGAPSVMLALELNPGSIPQENTACRFEVECNGKVVWSATRTGEAIRRQLSSRLATLVVAVPAKALPAARCELRVSSGEEGSGRVLFRGPFAPVRPN